MRIVKRYLPLSVVAVAVFAVAAVGAIADGDDSNPPSDGATQITSIQADARAAMSLLAGHRVAVDALPEGVADEIDEEADFGMNPDLSRLSIGNATNSVYVVPARDHVCATLTVGQGANLICPSTDEVAEGRAAPSTVTLPTGGIAIYGLVSDDVESVAVQTGTSDSAEVLVENNTYYTVVPAGTQLRTVSYVGPSGPVEFPIYDPRSAIEDS
jgi:hypothetical protein